MVVFGLVGAILAVVLVVGGVAAVALYGVFGYHPEENARSWAALTPRYGHPSQCAFCHAPQYDPWTTAKHNTVSCESCHGALADHAVKPEAAPAVVLPDKEQCITCHQGLTGRPASMPVVVLDQHFPEVTCLQCHNAHTSIAEAPRPVTHSLVNIPECVVCHGPKGNNPFPNGHSENPDRICLGCHKAQPSSQE